MTSNRSMNENNRFAVLVGEFDDYDNIVGTHMIEKIGTTKAVNMRLTLGSTKRGVVGKENSRNKLKSLVVGSVQQTRATINELCDQELHGTIAEAMPRR